MAGQLGSTSMQRDGGMLNVEDRRLPALVMGLKPRPSTPPLEDPLATGPLEEWSRTTTT